MKEFLKKHIYKLLIISLVFNLIGFLYVAKKIYYIKLYASNDFVSNQYVSILNYDSLPADAEIDKTFLLNTLVEKFDYNSYLEIGQGKAENNFNRIKCKIRIGVDPEPSCNAAYCLTSDDFFKLNKSTFDLIFVDGLHHKDQVYRDIINSLNCLNKNGTIVVHDCNPENEATQIVPQKEEIWTGDVWKAWVKLRSEKNDVEMFVLNTNGCGIIRVGEQKTIIVPDSLTYRYLSENRDYLLNLKSANDFLIYLKKN
ncbi:MAG: class I SAM-dependent methyltransferase [Bacteroidales bacterium]|jgi:hypothetical protein|nr:class I SAM-dependent methyltransferase [Bacteroidales bacterium]